MYETEPLYNTDQKEFLNCMVEITTDGSPENLLMLCKQVEQEMGREPDSQKNEPRVIDIDIVFFDDRVMQTENLTIPHSNYSERKFVLVPLCDLAPQFTCPLCGDSISDILARCPDTSLVHRYKLVETA